MQISIALLLELGIILTALSLLGALAHVRRARPAPTTMRGRSERPIQGSAGLRRTVEQTLAHPRPIHTARHRRCHQVNACRH
ncbi:hypothetical protein [Streptomyces sp. NPDC057428]|uniref:hypothetical protein n=1 Tax=Streptomyces sp. NPDC057428 TaxID=3346129 RepID=UPI0036A66B70